LIENQLERTDHNHLGKLLTYAAGMEAKAVIWIAARFTDEHRAAIDWLNRITTDGVRFFGVEVEVWKIDASLAVKFNVVSRPNDWAESAKAGRQAIESEIRAMQLAYWEAFEPVIRGLAEPISSSIRKIRPRHYIQFPIGRTKFSLAAAMKRRTKQVDAELYIRGKNAKTFFALLQDQKDAIEQELGFALAWEELPEGQDARIAVYLDNADPEDKADWPRQHDWLARRVNDLRRVLAPRVAALPAAADVAEVEEEVEEIEAKAHSVVAPEAAGRGA
jgi:hypothetical protein